MKNIVKIPLVFILILSIATSLDNTVVKAEKKNVSYLMNKKKLYTLANYDGEGKIEDSFTWKYKSKNYGYEEWESGVFGL